MPLKSDYNHIICIMEGETKNIRFVLKIYRFVLRLLNISFCGLYMETLSKEEAATVGLNHVKKNDITENDIRKDQGLNPRGAY